MDLTPHAGTNTFGRSAFMIHGDTISHPASRGCIVLRRSIREQINSGIDRELVVQ
jgi:hypothetical protein